MADSGVCQVGLLGGGLLPSDHSRLGHSRDDPSTGDHARIADTIRLQVCCTMQNACV